MVSGGNRRWISGARLVAALVVASIGSVAAQALTAQSWNGYKWSRTGPLEIKMGDNVSAVWEPYLTAAVSQWSAAENIDFVERAGTTVASSCAAKYGVVQVCSYNYGATGWLGYTSVWLGSGFINQATIKLNDYYFNQTKYNTAAWRAQAMCHEAGHALGLAHVNDVRTDPNTGSCMDVTNDPTGKALANATLVNTRPGYADFKALNGIYATLNSTQLSQTRPTLLASSSFAAEGFDEINLVTAVPEPRTWAMMIVGFGLVGGSLRRRSLAMVRT